LLTKSGAALRQTTQPIFPAPITAKTKHSLYKLTF